MGGAQYEDDAIIPYRPMRLRTKGRMAVSLLILMTMLVSSFIAITASLTGTSNITVSSLQDSVHQADADFIRHIICTWGTDNAANSEKDDVDVDSAGVY